MARPKGSTGKKHPALTKCPGLGRLLQSCKTSSGRSKIFAGAKGVSLIGKRLEACKRKK
jgi:hypothetical protein